MNVYIQYHSPTRGSQKPILFDRADTPEEAISLIATAKKELMENTTVFVGAPCGQCKKIVPTYTLTLNCCSKCCQDACDADNAEPDGGAYRDHQYT